MRGARPPAGDQPARRGSSAHLVRVGGERRPPRSQVHQLALQVLSLPGETLAPKATDRPCPSALHLVPQGTELDQQFSEFVLKPPALAGRDRHGRRIAPYRHPGAALTPSVDRLNVRGPRGGSALASSGSQRGKPPMTRFVARILGAVVLLSRLLTMRSATTGGIPQTGPVTSARRIE
jgi:hypothetical protein